MFSDVFTGVGFPLHEAVKLLSPLANLEELSLSGNKLGGTIPPDIAAFTKLKKLDISDMNLEGTRERFFLLAKRPSCVHSGFAFADISPFFPGEFPTALSKLVSLISFNVENNAIEGGG